MGPRRCVAVVAGIAVVLVAISVGSGADASATTASPAAASDGRIGYTVIRSWQQLFETAVAKASVKRIRATDAIEYGGAVSPDGRRLLFAASLDGGSDIYVAARDGKGERRLTRAPELEYDPAWSPSGRRVAWVRERGGRGEIWVMAADGTGQRRLVAGKDAHGPSWSPDGKRIVFWDATLRVPTVYVVAAAGGAARSLTTGSDPQWSPRGGKIALCRDVDDTSTLLVYDLVTRATSQPFPDAEEDDSTPVWSPGGTRLAFTRYDEESDSSDIWVVGVDGKGARRVVGTSADETYPRFTPDGKHLTFTSDRAMNADVAVAALDGSGERMVATGPTSWDVDPSFAPDASALAFVSDGPGTPTALSLDAPESAEDVGDYDIYTVASDGTGRRAITRSTADDVSPAWGRNGLIAFGSDRSGDDEIWVMAADGTGAKQVTRHDGWDGDPDWAPDASGIAYASERGEDSEIFTTSVDGRDTLQLTRNDVDDDAPAWSPDGKTIAYDSYVNDAWSIWVVPVDGSKPRRVTVGGYDEYPTWSPDGQWIVFSRTTLGLHPRLMRLMKVRPDGSGLSDVTNGRMPAWLPSTVAGPAA